MAAATQFVSIQPYFDVEEGKLEEFKAIWAGVTPKVKAETGCLYYGFTYNGNIAFCREGYSDAAAVLVHLGTVNEALGQALTISKLIRIEVVGPVSELAQLREPLAAMPVDWFEGELAHRQ
ncbi:hypothetical protein B484DRAFT_422073 [Ochromonadaceae sp. CCMP2298]|nr:hypothetical protein B484DRAFT_422073 [Ochromonadaceae sp. CCMP2298]|mmetsp:Transcript_21159/g.46987  ORF Transcript_21159/g.46987 Transcript_21159/m.46987 type:complete len:121 (+) Transcript_21159:56-418(+)